MAKNTTQTSEQALTASYEKAIRSLYDLAPSSTDPRTGVVYNRQGEFRLVGICRQTHWEMTSKADYVTTVVDAYNDAAAAQDGSEVKQNELDKATAKLLDAEAQMFDLECYHAAACNLHKQIIGSEWKPQPKNKPQRPVANVEKAEADQTAKALAERINKMKRGNLDRKAS